ncbi:uncharacterized protein si:dkey-30e9.6 [Anoplopoma fimbria]|uniref:uncharacterized protein si:dkey-30e9.6 n=1 Tax=Anoplopoma fimbria TaxID=229290 RepID=UPI0023EAFB01|nr:uncharacterized protein si:dkey-30e9.6 [Anoplopoma fimbria]
MEGFFQTQSRGVRGREEPLKVAAPGFKRGDGVSSFTGDVWSRLGFPVAFAPSRQLSESLQTNKWFSLPETESHRDVWSIKPPDFSLKLYRSFCKREESPKFISSYRPPDALESELMFVKSGKYVSGPYKNPKPHDFRPLNEDLPDIDTTYERDPGNLNLKLKHLDIIRTPRSDLNSCSRDTKTMMDTYKPAEPRWEEKLILPQLIWPPKSASYTRHRRRREAYSAFLDRVEEKLSRSWKNRS